MNEIIKRVWNRGKRNKAMMKRPKTWTALSIAVLVILETAISFSQPIDNYTSSKFKAPNDETPLEISKQWNEEDEALWTYVEKHVPAVLDHTGSAAFDEHLKGVQSVLRYWGSPKHLSDAGLLHSIYGTEGFQGFALPLSERSIIQQLIGEKAEYLCFCFCMVDRSTLDESVFEWKETMDDSTFFILRSRPELGRFELTLTKEDWLDFVELTLADWLEQVEGAATKASNLFLWKTGEAYAYRRLAYHKMSLILRSERPERLSKAPRDMVEAVYGTESSATRQLIQPRTPPMSDAAAFALEALRAAGEDIPNDLSPQPVSDVVESEL
jgi:hypothetical protein